MERVIWWKAWGIKSVMATLILYQVLRTQLVELETSLAELGTPLVDKEMLLVELEILLVELNKLLIRIYKFLRYFQEDYLDSI